MWCLTAFAYAMGTPPDLLPRVGPRKGIESTRERLLVDSSARRRSFARRLLRGARRIRRAWHALILTGDGENRLP